MKLIKKEIKRGPFACTIYLAIKNRPKLNSKCQQIMLTYSYYKTEYYIDSKENRVPHRFIIETNWNRVKTEIKKLYAKKT